MQEQQAGPSTSRSSGSGSVRCASTASRSPSVKGKERSIDSDEDDQDGSGGTGSADDDGDEGDEEDAEENGEEDEESEGEEEADGNESDEEDGEDGDDSSDEEEEEPTLKYNRLKGKLPEILAKDKASAIAVGARVIAIGTQYGMVHVLSYTGEKINSYRPHGANITCIKLDEENDFIATSSFEGRVMIHSLTSPESYAFDYKRPMMAIALEPGFGKKASRSFVCGGLAGKLVLQEKGWLGYKEQVLHSGEGQIGAIEWRGNLIAWANDEGVKIYDTASGQRIGYIDRGAQAPRAELFKCSLLWKDDHTLVIGWADYIKVVRVRSRPKAQVDTGLPPLTVEMTSVFQIDCMVSGIALFGSAYVILAYITPDAYDDEATEDRAAQRRKAANPPELRVIDSGEEITADALTLSNYHMYGCNDYHLVKKPGEDLFLIVTPSEIVQVRPRDEADHISWLVEHERFEDALESARNAKEGMDVAAIGGKYLHHLVDKGEYQRAASLAPKVFGQDIEAWTASVNLFLEHDKLEAVLPEIPTSDPRLERKTYDSILDHFLEHDEKSLLWAVQHWPTDIYDAPALIEKGERELSDDPLLTECMGELYLANKQPGKALPFFLDLRHPKALDIIRDFNLFTAIQDRVMVLFDLGDDAAVQLLVDHVHSVPMARVIPQLGERPESLYKYLRSLFDKDPQLTFPYSDRMIELSAEYDPEGLLPFLRASNSYDLEKAYDVTKGKDYVPEMVFLLGRMGNNKQALMLIIERLGDVQRAIEFATEQADDDLWEDLLQYSESRPEFIRALLEHVGAEINPIRLISRIRDGMEIPGLKAALIKIVQASNLQVSLSEGCHRILDGDCSALAKKLQAGQTHGAQASPQSKCAVCGLPAFAPPSKLALIYLCRHIVHAKCALLHPDTDDVPDRTESSSVSHLLSSDKARVRRRELGNRLAYASAVRVRVGRCPSCVHVSA